MNNTTEDVKMSICQYCGNTYKNERGLSIHLRNCKKRPANVANTVTLAANNTATVSPIIGTILKPAENELTQGIKQEEGLIEEIITLKLPTESSIKPKSNGIANRTALKEKVHDIHNFIRNNGGGYGFSAMRLFNFLYSLVCIEKYNLLEQFGLIEESQKFSYIYQLSKNDKFGDTEECLMSCFNVISIDEKLSRIIDPTIARNMRDTAVCVLIRKIGELANLEEQYNVHLTGKIYEYFIGREKSYISELGAYFTDRHIVDYLINKVNPQLVDGKVPTMIDPFGGSGGFTLQYVQHMINQRADWKDNIDNIYHYDINEDVVRSVAFELLCMTKQTPKDSNVTYINSFNDGFNGKLFDYVFTNPPYGGDKVIKSEASIRRAKVRNYILEQLKCETNKQIIDKRKAQLAQLRQEDEDEKKDRDMQCVTVHTSSPDRIRKYAAIHSLTGNDKESVSLILIMSLLSGTGTACAVLKEGVFFDSKYTSLRRHLIEKFDVLSVTSIDSKQFENTSTKTSAVIFKRGQTNRIKFYDLQVDRYTEDKFDELGNDIYLIEAKDDISGVHEVLTAEVSGTLILANQQCTMDPKAYNRSVMIPGDGYKLVKLSDLCKFKPKSKRPASEGKEQGKYNFYTSSAKVKRSDNADYTDLSIIIGTGGIANIHIDTHFSCSSHCTVLTSTNLNYIYHWLCANFNVLEEGFRGSCLKNISQNYIENILISMPTQDRIDYWTSKLSEAHDRYQQLLNQEVKPAEELRSIYNKMMASCETREVRLCDVCNFDIRSKDGKKPKHNTSEHIEGGLYPLYSGSTQVQNFIDTYDYDVKALVINTVGTNKYVIQIADKFNITGDVLVFTTQNRKFMQYNLTYMYGDFSMLSVGSTIKTHMNKDLFKSLTIKIPVEESVIIDFERNLPDTVDRRQILSAKKIYDDLLLELKNESLVN